MNNKLFIVMLALFAVFSITVGASTVAKASAPLVQISEEAGLISVYSGLAAQPVNHEVGSARMSGVIFLSDTDSPDQLVRIKTAPARRPQTACMSEDSLFTHRRQGGCIE